MAEPKLDLDIEIKLLLDAIYLKYSYDFRAYSKASIKRRVAAAVARYGCKTVSGLQERVIHDPGFFGELLQYLTVSVSEMFRDPSYFLSLREKVVPVLKTYPSLKVWIPGCSTGEELYSLAILLKEEGLLERSLLYATDINPVSLEKAKKGIFPIESVPQFTRNHQKAGGKASLSDYYTTAYDGAILDRSLVRSVAFADHSLATDSVFAEVQLVSCRNVLIYFDRELQDRAIGLFRDSLCHGGFLGLGSKESLRSSQYASSFEPFVPQDKIYRKAVA